jgi:hypothetical protein
MSPLGACRALLVLRLTDPDHSAVREKATPLKVVSGLLALSPLEASPNVQRLALRRVLTRPEFL